MSETVRTTVCVIGGGPAGSTIASRLAALGLAVCVVEQEPHPRPRLAAVLPASILPLLELIGVRDRVERAGFSRASRQTVWWADRQPVSTLLSAPGFHVDREPFDRLLLEHAAAAGARVMKPARVLQAVRTSDEGWKLRVRTPAGTSTILSRFVVDASGGGRMLPARSMRLTPPLIAVFAEWRTGPRAPTEGCVEAADDEWFWYGPLPDRRAVVAIFADPSRWSARQRAVTHAMTAPDAAYQKRREAYVEALRRFRVIGADSLVSLCGHVDVCDASSRYVEEPAEPELIRVGDASVRLDPLSSQGIQSAIVSAVQAAAVINTWVRDPASAPIASAFYRDRQQEHAHRHARRTAAFYRECAAVCDSPFWRERAGAGAPLDPAPEGSETETRTLDGDCSLVLSSSARIEDTPILRHDRIALTSAVHHETWERPVAFVDGVEIAPLVRQIQAGQKASSVVDTWSARVGSDAAWRILDWLWRRQVVIRC